MTKTLQLLGGTTAQNDAFTGAAREVTVDTQTHELRVHDGSTAGGFIIPTKSETQSPLGGGTAGTLLTNSGTSGTVNATSIDATPADGSNNPVASNGVYDALALKANTSLSNLTDTGANITNWSHNVTNCITEIPQDIQLEIFDDNGTQKLRLKAGSKVYVPNGSGVFNEVTISSDIVRTASSDGTGKILFYKNGTISQRATTAIESGSTPPSSALGQYLGWYDTTNNVIKLSSDGGSTWDSGWSFPFCITHDTSGNVVLDQVFNGFGYIGSTVFALPGVKGLIPNGRNADGSLKSIEVTVNNVLTHTGSYNNQPQWILLNSGLINSWDNVYWIGYNSQENILFNKEGSSSATSGSKITACVCAFLSADGNQKITAFTPKTAFHAVDYSDTEFIAHQAMPSARYTSLTLGASGSTYTAPADGWFVLIKEATALYQYIDMSGSGGIEMGATAAISGSQYLYTLLPASNGSSISIYYTAGGSTIKFRFIYANGAA